MTRGKDTRNLVAAIQNKKKEKEEMEISDIFKEVCFNH